MDYYGYFFDQYGTHEVEMKSCRVIHIFEIIRHGARFPNSKNIARLNNLKDLFSEFNLSVWKLKLSASDAGRITSQGMREITNIGKRLAVRFPELFLDINDHNLVDIRSSNSTRCLKSAQAFLQGLFYDKLNTSNNITWNLSVDVAIDR